MSAAALLAALETAIGLDEILNLAYALRVEGPLDVARLQAACAAEQAADPSLRGPPTSAGHATEEQLALLAATHVRAPLSVRGDTFRSAVWSVHPNLHLLLFSFHHAITDGVGVDRFARDLAARMAGRAVAPVPACDLPSDLPAMAASVTVPTLLARRTVRDLPAAVTPRLLARMRASRTTPFAAAVTAAAVALARTLGRTRSTLAFQLASRSSMQSLRQAGALYDHTCISVDTEGTLLLSELLHAVSTATTQTVDRPGGWARWRAGDLEPAPTPDALVVVDRHPMTALTVPGAQVLPLGVAAQPTCTGIDGAVTEHLVATDADLVFAFRLEDRGIRFAVFHKIARVSDAEAAALADACVEALDLLAAGAVERISALGPPEFRQESPVDHPRWARPRFVPHAEIDAVSPVFAPRVSSLDGFARDAAMARERWGACPWS